MLKIIVVNGKPGCGKTTFELLCSRQRSFVFLHSTIDFVKEVASFCGWNGEKTPQDRKFLSDLKALLVNWNDCPFQKIKDYCEDKKQLAEKVPENVYVFVDSREPKEVERFKNELGATIVLIRRPGDEESKESNRSDSDVFDCQYDLTIFNDSDMIDLEKKAKDFMNLLDKKE